MGLRGLVTSRVVVERNYAILPPEGIPESVLPEWTATAARILAAPALGARFAQYLLDLQPAGATRQALGKRTECFFYVIEGGIDLESDGLAHALAPGGYAYLKPGSSPVPSAPCARSPWFPRGPSDDRRAPDGARNPFASRLVSA